MKTLEQFLNEFQAAFTSKQRNDGKDFICLKDDVKKFRSFQRCSS